VLLLQKSVSERDDTIDLVVICIHGGQQGLVSLHQKLCLFQIGRCLVLAEHVLLGRKQNFSLLGIAVEHLEVETLGEKGLPVLPHLVHLLPAVLQGLQTLPQEHILGIIEGGRISSDLLSILHHGAVIIDIAVNFLSDLLVSGQQLLSLCQGSRRVLVGNV